MFLARVSKAVYDWVAPIIYRTAILRQHQEIKQFNINGTSEDAAWAMHDACQEFHNLEFLCRIRPWNTGVYADARTSNDLFWVFPLHGRSLTTALGPSHGKWLSSVCTWGPAGLAAPRLPKCHVLPLDGL
jgi:hypothetical protein